MTATQNYGNIKISTPILSADPNVNEDVMTDQQKITILYCRLSRKAFSTMGGTGNLQPPFLLRARDLQGNSEDVEQKQKNRHDGNGNGKTGTEAAVRAAAPQAAEGCRRGETP